jgi:hypothetical protein
MRLYLKKDLPELREKFLELNDPTGFKFAEKYLESYARLENLLTQGWFKNSWDDWQNELRARIKSEALKRIQEISEEGSAQSLNAAKYLANGEYLEGAGAKRGRPSKEEVSGELKRQVKAIDVLNEDFNRMTGLTVVQGGKK